MTNREATQLRAKLAAHVVGRGKRYDVELKGRVVAFAQGQRAQGQAWSEIARELDMPFETVRRWCVGRGPRAKRMREVAIVAAPRTLSALTISSPNGLRIEGVTLDDVVVLVRALG
jgi:hypothetical protein